MTDRLKKTTRCERYEEHTGDGHPEDGLLAEISIANWGAVVRRLKPSNSPRYDAERKLVEAELTVVAYGDCPGGGFHDADLCRVNLTCIDDLIELLQKTKAVMQKWAIDPDVGGRPAD